MLQSFLVLQVSIDEEIEIPEYNSTMGKEHPNISREELYRQVWADPVSKLATTYNVSGSYLARICRVLKVPTPRSGYWAQLKANKNPHKEALPTPQAGDPTMWIRSTTSSRPTDVMPLPPEPHSEIPPQRRSRPLHGPLLETKEILSKAKTPYSSIYLSTRRYKLVDLVTSQEHLEDSIALAQKLFSRLEDYNYRILLANADDNFITIRIETDEIPENKKEEYYSNAPSRPRVNTVAYLGTVAIGLTIVEMTDLVTMKDNSFYSYTSTYTFTKKVASRRYRLYAYSPYRHTELVKSWQDTKDSKLTKRLDEIVGEMEAMARLIPTLIIEGEKRAAEAQAKFEAEQREYQRKPAMEARKKAETESRNDLEKLIAAWATLKNQRELIDEIIRALEKEAPEIKDGLSARLDAAKNLLRTKSVADLIRSWKTPEERYALLPSWERFDDF
jgi:hypothetical protein